MNRREFIKLAVASAVAAMAGFPSNDASDVSSWASFQEFDPIADMAKMRIAMEADCGYRPPDTVFLPKGSAAGLFELADLHGVKWASV